MADADVQITAGSGTKIDTRTVGAGVDEHRQVVVVGDPSTDTAVAAVTAANGLAVDVTRVQGQVTIGDGTHAVAIDNAQSDAESNGVNSLHTSSRTYVFNGTTWDRARGTIEDGLLVQLSNANLPIGDGTNLVSVDTAPGDGESNTANLLHVEGRNYFFNGTSWDRVRGDTTNGMLVNVSSINPGTGATSLGKAEDSPHTSGDTGVMVLGVRNDNHVGRAATDGDYVPIALDGHGCVYVRGAGHDDPDIDGPVKVGARAIAHGANPLAVAADDRTDIFANRHGILFTIGGHPNVITRSVHIGDANGAQTDASMVGTIATGTKVVVTALSVTVDSATTATGGVSVKIGFGATTIPADSTTGANGVLLDHPGIAAGSGVVIGNGGGILGIGGDGEELRLTCEDPVGGNLAVTFSYYTIES